MDQEVNAGTRYQGVQKESAGYKLLMGMGWKEGEGLGASKQGIKEHIKVKKKFENWGVGAVRSYTVPDWCCTVEGWCADALLAIFLSVWEGIASFYGDENEW